MACVEAVGRQFAKHMEFRIGIAHLGHVVPAVTAYVAHPFCAASGMRHLHVFKRYIADYCVGQTCDAVGKRIVDCVDIGAPEVVGLVGTPEGDFTAKISDYDVRHAARMLAAPVAEAHEEGVAGIYGVDAVDLDAVDHSSVDRFDCNGRAKRIGHADALHPDSAEAAETLRSHLYGVGAAAHVAVGNADVAASGVRVE